MIDESQKKWGHEITREDFPVLYEELYPMVNTKYTKLEVVSNAYIARRYLSPPRLLDDVNPGMTVGKLETCLNHVGIYLVRHHEVMKKGSIVYETNKSKEATIHSYTFNNMQREMLFIASIYGLHRLYAKPNPKIEFTLGDFLSKRFETRRWRCHWWCWEFVYPLKQVEFDIANGMSVRDLCSKWNYNIRIFPNYEKPMACDIDDPRIWSASREHPSVASLKAVHGLPLSLFERFCLRFSKSYKQFKTRIDGSNYEELYGRHGN